MHSTSVLEIHVWIAAHCWLQRRVHIRLIRRTYKQACKLKKKNENKNETLVISERFPMCVL